MDTNDQSNNGGTVVDTGSYWPLTVRASLVIGLSVLSVALCSLFFMAADIVILIFFGVLFAIFLANLSRFLVKYSGIAYGWSLAVVVALLLLMGLGGIFLLGTQIESQIERTTKKLDETQAKLEEWGSKHPTARAAIASTPFLRDLLQVQTEEKSEPSPMPSMSVVKSAVGVVSKTVGRIFQTSFGFILNSAIIFFVGIFVASNPTVYEVGLLRLFPHSNRPRVREVLGQLGDTLWRWLLGRFGSMLVTGLGIGASLWFLGVPLAWTLGVITGLLTFIPNIGAAIALGLAVLISLPVGLEVTFFVIVAYIVFQMLESYIVTPLIQRRQVSIPPALLISAQAIASILLGFLGAMVASPLLAVVLVVVREAYCRDVLGDD